MRVFRCSGFHPGHGMASAAAAGPGNAPGAAVDLEALFRMHIDLTIKALTPRGNTLAAQPSFDGSAE